MSPTPSPKPQPLSDARRLSSARLDEMRAFVHSDMRGFGPHTRVATLKQDVVDLLAHVDALKQQLGEARQELAEQEAQLLLRDEESRKRGIELINARFKVGQLTNDVKLVKQTGLAVARELGVAYQFCSRAVKAKIGKALKGIGLEPVSSNFLEWAEEVWKPATQQPEGGQPA